ncbi:hypothetical protein CHGG_07744 [Chaetomium globosum CBS 148.51]|uniref:F-box domain-containing protein n=1 Tax=Chaetomium globosum (strain ATCC 6205 / CBS 148.51 / DSM 1962 / NBRC 6347 / NRRL 1970) TaxID=306901 RepID=Q2GWB0_CHAGB|nr:uncharacterized protein CHGG_07744 [Chaetomium globosum CBS 148.51]EAQ86491.1 hypothetical protein CHGG_07744 [Chaetomium globosum CBS 148.51]
MSASSGNGTAVSVEAARRRLALAQAARANATREEIEARGIRPNVQQIVHHMNRTPSHSFKRVRLNHSARKIYEDEDGEEGEDTENDCNTGGTEEDDEKEFEQRWQALLAESGLQKADMFVLAEFRQIARQRIHMMKQATTKWHALSRPPKKDRFDLLASLCSCTELIVEVCKHMRPLDIVHLYSVSKNFHYTINEHMRSSIFAWASHMAPTAARIYSSPVYCRWFIPDPCRRRVTANDQEMSKTQPGQAKVEGQLPLNGNEGEIRLIPGLLWLQMTVNREIRVRDIIACLARRGHRLPEGSHQTLKKIWLIMDAATTQARMMLLNNPDFFSNEDLYIAQLFMVKLILAFNDPVFGPQSSMLMRLMLGQRGLSPLWALLRGLKYRTAAEIRQLKLRYDVGPDQLQDENLPAVYGVDIDRLGVIHFEGWGTGPDHLMRPDELIPLESARRQLDLDVCVEEMMIYGHVDFNTGNSLVPSLEEMYMSDDDLPPACKGWTPLKHELIHSGCGNDGDRDVADRWGEVGRRRGQKEGGKRLRLQGEDSDTSMMMVGGGDAVGDGEGAEEEEEEGEEEEDGQFDLDWDEFLRNPSAFVMEAGQVVAREEGGGDETEEDVGDGDMEMADEYDDEDQDEEEEEDDITFLMGGLQVGQAPDGYQQVTQQMAEVQGTNGLDLAQYVVDEDVGEDARTKKLRDWFRPW